MGKLVIGTGLFMVGIFLTFTVVGAIPGIVLIITGGSLMFAGFASITKSTVKGGITAGKVIRELNKERDTSASTSADLVSAPSTAEEIRKLGELLQSGLLTQDEFDRKKAQLLT